MKQYIAIIILLLTAIALAVSLLARPVDPPLAADPQSPGAWPDYAAGDAQRHAMPQMLLSPCPLTPQNLPIRNPNRKADA